MGKQKKKSNKSPRATTVASCETAKKETSEGEVPLPSTRVSDEPPSKRGKWINRQRVLAFAARGTTQRDRHLLKDLKSVMPHSKDENKMERRENLSIINEMCQMKNCNKALFIEGRKKKDLYLWVSNVPEGPSVKFLVESIFTMGELKLTGNCLKGSRPILSFDEHFEKEVHYSLIREIFVQVFGVPNHHPKSQPFVDRVINFKVLDNRIWYRHYQILREDGALAEVGPRFVLNPIKIFAGSFGGATLWENPHYVSPSLYRRQLSMTAGQKYLIRQSQKIRFAETAPKSSYPSLPEDDVFEGDPLETAAKMVGQEVSESLKKKARVMRMKPRKRGKKGKQNKLSKQAH